MASPRFSNGNTCWMPGSSESAAVRSAHASTTVRARDSEIDAKEPSVAGEKHTTSHRPTLRNCRFSPTSDRESSDDGASAAPSGPASSGPNDGERFSNTATSYRLGISEGFSGVCGASGSWSAGGRNTRFCRLAAMETHSPVRTSWRMRAVSGRGSSTRWSMLRSAGSVESASSK